MKTSRVLCVLSAFACLAGCAKPADTPVSTAASEPTYPSVQVVTWSDFHSSIYEANTDDGKALGGLPVFMAAVEKLRGDGLSLVLDAGDMFQGAMPFNEAKGLGMIEMMNALHIDAATFGNHEFDYGHGVKYPDSARGALREAVEASNFPWVNANVVSTVENDDSWSFSNLSPYVILQKGPYRIAVVGVLAIETPIATIAANVEGLEFKPVAAALTEVIPKVVAENPDFIVVEAHVTGTPEPLPEDGNVPMTNANITGEIAEIAALPEDIRKHIGLVLAGHSHKSFIVFDGDLTIVENYSAGREITTMTLVGDDKGLHLDRSSIKKHELRHERIDAACGETPKPLAEMKVGDMTLTPSQRGRDIVTKYEGLMKNNRCEVVGCTSDYINRNYDGECPLGNLVADAIRSYYPEADIAIQNAGGVRIDVPKGDIYRETLNALMPFENYLYLVDMTGEDVLRALKVSSTAKHGATKVSGIHYAFEPNCTNPADINGDGTIESWENNCLCDGVTVNGKPLKVKSHYKVAVSDFIYKGGDSHAGVFEHSKVLNEGPVMKDAILDYVKKQDACFTAEGLSPKDAPRIEARSCGGKFSK